MRSLYIILLSIFLVNCSAPEESETALHYQIQDDSGKLIPGKLIFFKNGKKFNISPTSDQKIAFRNNTLYTLSGSGNIELPAGEYEIWAGRGLEWSGYNQTVTIEQGSKTDFKAILSKQLKTPGYISGDMHLHTFTHSGHGDSNVEERIVSCIGEGLEWAVATDHNHVIDYIPVMQNLEAIGMISSTVGNEVSTPIGHFNTYPLVSGSEPVKSDISDANVLFKLIRESASNVVLQVNHPRWPSGDYFTFKNINEYYGTTDDETWSWDFDAIEILNVNSGLGWIEEPQNPISVKRDWYNLLNRGRRITGVGNSDSHTVLTNLAGLPRNYIKSSSDNIGEIDESEIAQSIKDGNVSVSRGLYVEFSTEDTQIGGITTANNGKVAFNVRVQGADWVDCDTIKLIRNGEEIKSLVVQENQGNIRFDSVIEDQPTIDSWYLIVAKGNDTMSPLADNADGSFFPLAFTNPIWVDADGDGSLTSVRQTTLNHLSEISPSRAAISSLIDDYPEFKPFIGEYLLSRSLPNAEELLQLLGEKGDLYTRLFVYRSLATMGTPAAKKTLENVDISELSMLEQIEVELAQLSFFNSEEEQLRTSLLELRNRFKFYQSGADTAKLLIGTASNPAEAVVYAGRDGSILIDEGGPVFTQMSAFSRTNGTAPFLIKSESPIEILANDGVKLSNKANSGLKGSLMEIPVERGLNTIKFNLGANNSIIIEPIFSIGPLVKNAEGMSFNTHLGVDKTFSQLSNHSSKYSAGIGALNDGFSGTRNYADGFWRGYNEGRIDYVIDLGEAVNIAEVSVNFLENQGAWIFLPSSVEIQISQDSTSFKTVASKSYETKRRDDIEIIRISAAPKEKVRYVRLHATSPGTLPEWHAGKGENSWIFADEITIR